MLDVLIESLNLAAAFYLAMLLYALTRPPNIINRLLGLIMLACAIWAFSYYQELQAHLLETKLFWMILRHVPLPFLTVLWLMLSFRLAGIGRWIKPPVWCALCVIPVLTVFIALTCRSHAWFRYGFSFLPDLPMQPLLFTEGPWCTVYNIYILALQLIGITMLVRAWRPAAPLARRQIGLLLFSSLFPIVASQVFNARLLPLHGLNPAPLLLFPAAATLALAVFRFQLTDVAPIARDMLFDHIHDGILFVDTAGHVVDLNPAAARMLGVRASELVGRKPQAAPAPWSAPLDTRDGATQAFCCEAPSGSRWYERTRVPILCEGSPRGWLFIFQDITDRTALQQQRIREVRLAEEGKRVRQWSTLLRDLHDGIGSVSANIGILAELARQAPTAEAKDKLLAQIAELATEGNIELRTMMNSLEARDLSWTELLAEIRRFAALVLEPRGIRFALDVVGTPGAAPGIVTGTSLFRVVKEAVTNAAKHAFASSVSVGFRFSGAGLELSVSDDGRWQTGRPEGRGLRHLRQRVADLGGTFRLETAPATRLTCLLPAPVPAESVAQPLREGTPT